MSYIYVLGWKSLHIQATFRFVQMHGILWSKCNVPSRHHVLCMMLKGILVDIYIYMLHKWNPKFECLHVFLKFQTKFAGHGANIISHVTVHPDCAKFEFIWTMLARWISTCNGREVPNWLGFDVHDRLASYLNFESGVV